MKKIIIVMAVLLILLYGVYIYFLNATAPLGIEYGRIDREIQRLSEENQTLHEKIATEASLIVIEKKARAMGFRDTSTIVLSPQDGH